MGNKIKGILVGCDDQEEVGYEWVINHKDWDNGSKEITDKLIEYKTKKDFKIYFYVFKTQTDTPADTSDEYRGTIFGRADIKKVEPYKNDPNQGFFPHHVKLKNLELFDPKIKLEDIEVALEKYGWTDKQKANNPFPNNLRQHGLLLTKNDYDLINKYVSNNNFNSDNLDDMEDVIVIMGKRKIETDDDVIIETDRDVVVDLTETDRDVVVEIQKKKDNKRNHNSS